MGDGQPERECVEYLQCPVCRHVDLEFGLVDYRIVRCFGCGATVQVTGYQVHLGRPGEPLDHIGLLGEVLHEAVSAEGGPG